MRNLYEKYDISKYEIPETKYEATKLVLQFFLGGEKNLVFRNVVFFVQISHGGRRPLGHSLTYPKLFIQKSSFKIIRENIFVILSEP